MPPTEFGEGQFEDDLLQEIKSAHGGSLHHFRPTEPVEKYLPFDIGLHLPVHPWVLHRRIHLAGLHVDDPVLHHRLPASSQVVLPHYWVNTFIQTKVPYYVSRSHPKTAQQWQRWRRPYYRLSLEDEQHAPLITLEADLNGLGLVRYAAPCFWQWTDLSVAVTQGAVVDRSHFQSPGRIGNHLTYTYGSPHGRGWGFSDPEEIDSSTYLRDIVEFAREEGPRAFVVLIAKVWIATMGLRERFESYSISSEDVRAASMLLGARQDLPVDPTGLLERDDAAVVLRAFGEERALNLGHFVAHVFALERFFRLKLNLHWRVVSV